MSVWVEIIAATSIQGVAANIGEVLQVDETDAAILAAYHKAIRTDEPQPEIKITKKNQRSNHYEIN